MSLVSQKIEKPKASDGAHFIRYTLGPDERGNHPNAVNSITLVREAQGDQEVSIAFGNEGARVAKAVRESLAKVNITGEVNHLGTSFVVRSDDPAIVMRTTLALNSGNILTTEAAGDIITHEYERTRMGPEQLHLVTFAKEGKHETVRIHSDFSPVAELIGDSRWVKGGKAAVTHVTVHGDPTPILDKLRKVDKWATVIRPTEQSSARIRMDASGHDVARALSESGHMPRFVALAIERHGGCLASRF